MKRSKEDSKPFGIPKDLLLQLRQELRHERRFTLADRVLELLRPQLEAEELWVEDGQEKSLRHAWGKTCGRHAQLARTPSLSLYLSLFCGRAQKGGGNIWKLRKDTSVDSEGIIKNAR